MKHGLLALVLLLGSSAYANHETILDTKDLTCQQAIALVNNNGIKHFKINGAGPIEFLSAESARDFCGHNLNTVQEWAPTSDAANCPIGFQCQAKPF